MSGSGGGGYGGGGEEVTSCEDLRIQTTLNSPKPEVVKGLKKSDVLEIENTGDKGPVVAKTNTGKVAGTITSGDLLRLIRCMADGYTYVAIVKAVDRGRVDVEVRAESKK